MKKSLKAIIAICLVVVLAGTIFAACSTQKPETGEKIYTIGICQWVEHPALDAAQQGFVAAIYDKIGQENVKIDPQNAQEDSGNCTTIINQFVSKGVDLMLAIATPALQTASSATDQIPIVATAITEYGVALNRTLDEGKTGINVTGTSDLPPLDQQAAMIPEVLDDIRTVGIIYCSREDNSQYQVDEVSKYLKEMGIEVNVYSFAESTELQAITQKAVAENEALYIPTDNAAAKATDIIDAVARPAKCPVFAGEEGICRGCGIVTLSINYYDIGYKAGQMAAEILLEGKDPAAMPIEYAPKFTKEYNPEICAELGIEVSEEYVAIPAE
ncbi:MAG: ABC transporter substrate-binding protein [Eubacterium sp.]|nr:ABC transporter substrate-binding protein [Eubacterium sp.]